MRPLRAGLGSRAPFAYQQKANSFEQFRGHMHALGQEDVGLSVPIVDPHLARKQNRRRARRNGLNGFDELGAVQAGHDQVAQHQIDVATAETGERLLAVQAGYNAVAARLQQHLANGKRLFVVVDTENRALRLHCRSWGRLCGIKPPSESASQIKCDEYMRIWERRKSYVGLTAL